MSEIRKAHLVHEAYVSLLKHAERCDHDPDYDWADEPKDRRHAMNAALDLRDAYAALADKDAEIKRLRDALEEAENKLRAHDGLVALKNGIPETTGDPVFDEVLRVYPVAEMIQRGWLGSATGFEDLPFLKKSLLRFFETNDLSDLLDAGFSPRIFRRAAALATPAPEQAQKEQP